MSKIVNLQEALEFLDHCRKNPRFGPDGILRDAERGVETAARDVVSVHRERAAKDDAARAAYWARITVPTRKN